MRRAPIVALVALAACSKPQPVVDNRTDVAALSAGGSAAIPHPTLQNGAMIPAIWHFQASSAGSAAIYGEDGAYPALSIRCEPDERSIAFVRDGEVPASGAMLRIVTSEGKTASFPALPANENRPVAIARTTSGDTFLRGPLSSARSLITVTLGSGAPLTLPADAAIGQVIASCPQ